MLDKTALDLACELLWDIFGTCPMDQYDWTPPWDCGEVCNTPEDKMHGPQCWKTYLEEQATKISI